MCCIPFLSKMCCVYFSVCAGAFSGESLISRISIDLKNYKNRDP